MGLKWTGHTAAPQCTSTGSALTIHIINRPQLTGEYEKQENLISNFIPFL